MVKKTVNFDDPGTYHFYYGNEEGMPGTILTFFPWEGIGKGTKGVGMATEIGYSVPVNSIDFWMDRFKQFNISFGDQAERFGETLLPFTDPDDLNIALIVPKNKDERKPWQTNEVTEAIAAKGFYNATLKLKNIDAIAKILTGIFGYTLQSQEGNRYRFTTNAISNASIIDILEVPDGTDGRGAAGTNQ